MKLGNNLFRDTRSYGPSSSYFLQLEGLKVGRTYTLAFTAETGSPPRFWIIDNVVRYRKRQAAGFTYTFTATATARTIQVNTELIP